MSKLSIILILATLAGISLLVSSIAVFALPGVTVGAAIIMVATISSALLFRRSRIINAKVGENARSRAASAKMMAALGMLCFTLVGNCFALMMYFAGFGGAFIIPIFMASLGGFMTLSYACDDLAAHYAN